MNERIEALAKQAAEYAIEFAVKDQELYIPKLMEKFAELIIKECIEQVKDQYLPVIEDDIMMKDPKWIGYVHCGVDSVVAIKEHFGVEE